MTDINRVIISGNITHLPVLRHTTNNTAVVNLCVASNVKIPGGERSCFIDVTVWGRLAENTVKYCTKGSPVLIEGRLEDHKREIDGISYKKIEVKADSIVFAGYRREKHEARKEIIE